jgi:ribulose-5-phosphate 4-epimerase/fuculose-1-phosphate aldolase
VAVSAQKAGLLPISQQSTFLIPFLGYHDYEGVALRDEEKPRLAANLAGNRALILRNHGLLTVGRTIGEAFNWMHRLELSCKAQLAAQATGQKIMQVPQKVVEETWNNYQPGTRRPYGVMEWPALLRKLDRIDPSYRE